MVLIWFLQATPEDVVRMQKILSLRRAKLGLYKFLKVLNIETDKQILNTYVDEEPISDEASEYKSDILEGSDSLDSANIACRNQYGMPFPGFLCPLMKIMAHQYENWRSKVGKNLNCEDLMDLNTHPCNHNISFCVLIALPNSHLILGCMDHRTGQFTTPQKWVGSRKNYTNYLLDFRVDNPLRLTHHCKRKNGKPVCLRNNLFFRKTPILQQLTCCCTGDFCADALFDQSGFNPVPFIHISTELKSQSFNL